MFGKKNDETKNSSGDTSSLNTKLDKQKIVAEISQHPIHTLKSDLATLEISGKDSSNPSIEIHSEKSKISANSFAPEIKTSLDSTKDFSHSKEINTIEKKSSLGKLFFSVLILLVVAILAGGGYYFWVTRVKNATPADQSATSSSSPDTTTTATSPATTNLSAKQANFLSVDIQNSDSANLKTTFQRYVNQVTQLNAPGPIEFIITDKNNTPVAFHDFAQKLGLTLPQSILSQLNDTFSFYIYLDNAQPRFGLSVHPKDTTIIRAALTQEEGNLPQDLTPILPDSAIINTPVTFNSSTYNGAAIRYTTSISSPTNTSIDYTLAGNALIIGTSKMTTRSILDYLSK